MKFSREFLYTLGVLGVMIIITSVIALKYNNQSQQLLAQDVLPASTQSNQFDCSQCLQANQKGICFNVDERKSYCIPNPDHPDIGFGVICRRCDIQPSLSPAPTCIPIPPQCEPGSQLGIACPAAPPGGWCATPSAGVSPSVSVVASISPSLTSSPSVTSVPLPPHLILKPNPGFSPNNCGFDQNAGNYVCVTSLYVQPDSSNANINWQSTETGLAGMSVTPASGTATTNPTPLQLNIPQTSCSSSHSIGTFTFNDSSNTKDTVKTTFNCAPVPTVTPPSGCYYTRPVCTIACSNTNPNCCPPVLFCPSPTPIVCGQGMTMSAFNPNDNSVTHCVTPTPTPTPRVCNSRGLCIFGFGCGPGTTCKGWPLGECIPNTCQ